MPTVKEACINNDIPFVEPEYSILIDLADNLDLVLDIPLSYKENGIEYINVNGVVRPTCKYNINFKIDNTRTHNITVDFDTFIYYILFERSDITGVDRYGMSIYDMIHKPTDRRDSNFIPKLIRRANKFIGEVVNSLPQYKSSMNSWAVNKRITFLDPKFDTIVDPNEKLEYQVNKANKYFDKGWTLMGLSDSNLSECNYIFTDDLRKYTPFGIKHHNPQRNLYQTLGMKGDELPAIRSKSQQELIDRGIPRKGWNVPTLFIDVPMNFEDQIMIHRDSWKGRSVKTRSVVAVYGSCFVKPGAELRKGETVGLHMDGADAVFNLEGAKHKVVDVIAKPFHMGDKSATVYSVVVETTRYFKEGFKLTNAHGNKGIVRMFDDGYVIHDPVKGDVIPQVVVSFKSVTKRKNFGQIVEALASRVTGCTADSPIVVDDDIECSIEFMQKRLKDVGYDSELVEVDTPYGTMKAIWGNVFWGCIKTAEENVWDYKAITAKNSKGFRKKGLKFSHMEFRSLITTFGPKNPIAAEILQYANGSKYLMSKIQALRLNMTDPNLPIVDCNKFNTIEPSSGIMHEENDFKGTTADPEKFPDGAIIKIPKTEFKISRDVSIDIEYVYLPVKEIREYWQHKSGLKAVDTLGMLINNVVHCAKNDGKLLGMWLAKYYEALTRSIGSKTGDLAQIGMAVRYPKSVKATAVVSDTLPKNTIEIHTSMAKFLKVEDGDPVLVERFPCLGFMSLRAQYIKVTDDEDCRYTIRVSNNCLVSQNLDFDGDTLYIAAFHTPEAREALYKVLKDDALYVNQIIEKMNNKKIPCIHSGGFDELGFITFPELTKDEHAKIISRAVGVKAHTGPVIALAYNLMRITETEVPLSDMKTNVDIEVMLDFLGNTVFSQKHGIRALHDDAINAICTGNVDEMVNCGFNRETSNLVINIVKKYANKMKVSDLAEYHREAKENGHSNIINRIVREHNKVYFASRAIQSAPDMFKYINSEAVDIPSMLFQTIMSRG